MASDKDQFISACATLMEGEAGDTGDWRAKRPVIDLSKCTPCKKNKDTCYLCWLYCPDGTVNRGIPVEINLTYCKGCGICAEVCPTKAIEMEVEEKFVFEQCALQEEGEQVRTTTGLDHEGRKDQKE